MLACIILIRGSELQFPHILFTSKVKDLNNGWLDLKISKRLGVGFASLLREEEKRSSNQSELKGQAY
jgi:hypothetical protein